jgi:SpoVK/Ycf46/Vps4 family AAA+-type ATPase
VCIYDFFSDLKKTFFPNHEIYLVRDYDNIPSYNIDDKGNLYKDIGNPFYVFFLIDKNFENINNSVFFLKCFVLNLTFVENDEEYNILCTDGFSIIEFGSHNRKLAVDILKNINVNYDFYVNTFDEVPSFEIVMRRNNGYFTRNVKLKDFNPIFNLSTHYNGGDDFLKWDEKYIYTTKKKREGISIFHGPAGTGKTSYIKKLSYELKNTHKFFLMPAQMIVQLHEPGLLQNFIMDNIVPMIEDGWKVVLVLEDAEEVLKSRDKYTNPYISTILNLSDGIMGEIYNFQIICTMNSNIEDIDSALLRPNRLISCKKFDYLNEKEAINLYKDISGRQIDKIDFNLIIDESNIENESYKKDIKRMREGKYTVGEIYKLVESSDPNMLNGYIDSNTQQKSSTIGFNMLNN